MGHKQLLGLLGHPVEHSISPMIHNYLSEKHHLEYYYHAFDVEPGSLKQALNGMKALKIKGFNVTIPYKEMILPYMDELSEAARKIGALNTVHLIDNRWIGHNTDLYGFQRTLESHKVDIKDKNIVILGFGGATKAVLQAILEKDPGEVTVLRRQVIVNEIMDRSNLQFRTYEDFFKESSRKVDCLINTTPVGLRPESTDEIFFQKIMEKIEAIDVAIDIIYNKNSGLTSFLKAVEKYECSKIDGLEMLVYQAAKSFEIWTKCRVNEDELLRYTKQNMIK